MDTKRGLCDCTGHRQFVRFESKGCNHILHLFLALITAGIWTPIWILCAISRDWRCGTCGNRYVSSINRKALARRKAEGL